MLNSDDFTSGYTVVQELHSGSGVSKSVKLDKVAIASYSEIVKNYIDTTVL